MKKKSFRLVELLSGIVILAVIVVIAVPQISKVIKQTKINSLASTAKLIAAKAEEKEVENQATELNEPINCTSLVKLDDDYDGTSCTIEKINGVWTTTISGSSTGKFAGISCSGTKSNMVCTSNDLAPGEYLGAHPCTYEGELVDGATYVYGQYKYTYIASTYNTWEFASNTGVTWDDTNPDYHPSMASPTRTTTGGWHVEVNRPTVPYNSDITSTICSSINNKPIISMVGMYKDIENVNVDLSTIDTSNVIDMTGMFWQAVIHNLDASNFDTSNVESMKSMFYQFGLYYNHDLDKWESLEEEIIGLDHFNTAKVINMNNMFNGYKAETLDLSSFDTSSVIDFDAMLGTANTIYASDAFVTTSMDVNCNPRGEAYSCTLYIGKIAGLVGGNGTDCHSVTRDSTYARIDAPGQPGCFTAKP